MSTYSIGGEVRSGTSNVEIDDVNTSVTYKYSNDFQHTFELTREQAQQMYTGFITVNTESPFKVSEKNNHEKLMDACFNE